MRDAKPQCFHVSGKNFTGNEKFPGNIYLKPEESPEDRGFCIVNNVMAPYDLYEILPGFSFLVSNFSNLSNNFRRVVEGKFHSLYRMEHKKWQVGLLGNAVSLFLFTCRDWN